MIVWTTRGLWCVCVIWSDVDSKVELRFWRVPGDEWEIVACLQALGELWCHYLEVKERGFGGSSWKQMRCCRCVSVSSKPSQPFEGFAMLAVYVHSGTGTW